MLQRCTNPKNPGWENYGGRGIRVCDRWRKFENFLADIGPRPDPSLTLDRLDNDGNYEPGNCAWRTWKEQIGNQRARSRKLPPNALPDILRRLDAGESLKSIGSSYGVSGTTIGRAVPAKYKKQTKARPFIEFNGRKYYRDDHGLYRSYAPNFSMLHRDIWEAENGPIPDGYRIRHQDHNPENNDPGNLIADTATYRPLSQS